MAAAAVNCGGCGVDAEIEPQGAAPVGSNKSPVTQSGDNSPIHNTTLTVGGLDWKYLLALLIFVRTPQHQIARWFGSEQRKRMARAIRSRSPPGDV